MEIQTNKKQLFVALGGQIDLVRFPQISFSAKIAELNKSQEFIYYQIENLKAASNLCKYFIKEFDLGSSNWVGGRIIDENNNFVASVSYNGRVWDREDYKEANEVQI